MNDDISYRNLLVGEAVVKTGQLRRQRLGHVTVLHGNLGTEHVASDRSANVNIAELLTLHSDAKFQELTARIGWRQQPAG